MSEDQNETLADTVERVRADKFPHIDKDLVREILRLHGEQEQSSVSRTAELDALIRQHLDQGDE